MSGGLLRISAEGQAARHAAEALERHGAQICTAIRRTLPFLVRRGLRVVMRPPFAGATPDALRSLAPPLFVRTFMAAPAGAVAHLALDAYALALVVDGVLGGDSTAVPTLRPEGLSAPQLALATRVADGLGRAISDVLGARMGIQLTPTNAAKEPEGVSLVCVIDVGSGDSMGTIVLALPRACVPTANVVMPSAARAPDPLVAAAVEDVDVELTVELGRVPVTVSRLVGLKPGDTLLLDAPVSSPVVVRADGRTLFSGRPSAVAGRFAVRIEDRHEG